MPVEISDRGLHCLILYHRYKGDLAKLTGKDPVPLLSAGTRFLVEHQLHWLGDQGFKQIRLALDDRGKPTEALVGDGSRWGSEVNYAFDAQSLDFQARLRKHRGFVGEGMLLLEGNALVRAALPASMDHTTLFFHDGQLLPCMFCSGKDYEQILEACDARDILELCTWVRENLNPEELEVDAFYYQLDELGDFTEMTQEMLEHPELFHFMGQTQSEGVRQGRRVHLNKTAALVGPVVLGDDAYLKADCRVGPDVFIGQGSFIERGATIRNSVIAPNTYVGRNTTFDGKYVCRNYVVDLESKTSIFVDDPLILGDLTRGGGFLEHVERGMALVLLLLCLPLLILLMPLHRILRGRWLLTERILVQPVPRNFKSGYDFQWTTWQRFNFGLFALDLLPSLGDIVLGKIKFVGNPPLSEADLEALDDLFRGDQLRGKAGLTGPVQQLDGETTSPDEVFATTIYYNATRSFKGDMRLFFHALIPGVHQYKRTLAHGSHHP